MVIIPFYIYYYYIYIMYFSEYFQNQVKNVVHGPCFNFNTNLTVVRSVVHSSVKNIPH